jgi:hypothetical protein
MKRGLGGSIFLAIGGLIGIATAIGSVDMLGSSALRDGSPWRSWDTSTESKTSFYASAHYLLNGRLPPAPGQLQEMTTERDSDGELISSSCSYLVTGPAWKHMWWSFAAATSSGTAPRVSGMATSDSFVYEKDGSFKATVSALPAPGNWIRSPDTQGFTLIFTVAGESGLARREPLPELVVKKESCS